MTEIVDCVVIGAGVVGLAVARACAQQGWETVLVEAANAIGTGTSSRNSEVIHAGIYYPQGSLKARLCVRGKDLLYAYCAQKQLDHARCGKLIVATQAGQLDALRALREAAARNGVTDLRWLERDAARALEPALNCVAALESPSTGIVDSHGLMLALQGDFERAGGMLALCSPIVGGWVSEWANKRVNKQMSGQMNGQMNEPTNEPAGSEPGGSGSAPIVLETGGDEPMTLAARRVVNSAGLRAQAVAATLRGLAGASIAPARYAKGNYYSLAGKAPFSRLIYPVPEPGGLGVHLTLDLGRQARFGPDVEWLDGPDGSGAIDYRVNPARARGFYAAIRTYWPDLPDDALQPGYSGIRPKLADAGNTAYATYDPHDFLIQDARTHGVAGLVNLYGIESPGLTASLAIAEEVVGRLTGA